MPTSSLERCRVGNGCQRAIDTTGRRVVDPPPTTSARRPPYADARSLICGLFAVWHERCEPDWTGALRGGQSPGKSGRKSGLAGLRELAPPEAPGCGHCSVVASAPTAAWRWPAEIELVDDLCRGGVRTGPPWAVTPPWVRLLRWSGPIVPCWRLSRVVSPASSYVDTRTRPG
jgi:hypothetical protein